MDARRLAIEVIEKIIDKKGYTHIVVNEYLRKFELSEEDKAFFTKLTYGTIENLLTIDYYLEPYIGKKRQKPWLKYLLYISIYQIVYLKIPEYAVINEAVNIANIKDRAVGGFVNAVLRNFLRNDLREIAGFDEITTLSLKYSYPAWLVAYLLKDYKYEEVELIFKEFAKVKKTSIRVNTIKITKQEVINILKDDGYNVSTSLIAPSGLLIEGNITNHKLLKSGNIIIQDQAAQLVSEIVNPQLNAEVIDLCSAPGGKASHLSCLMNNTGTITACDIHEHKIKLMNKFFIHNGNSNIKTKLIDVKGIKSLDLDQNFDEVLADVPCSGLGVMGHKVDLKYQINLESIQEIITLQKEILNSTWGLVKPNGHYTYSTCTLNKEENEEQIKNFLKNNKDAMIVYEKTILPYEYGSDGFYICKLRKN